mmetsp:Transcript_24589/g.41002  ORF Transcript_24589/g.41002 Transcript_24589/m.41002 type:complete len:260 (-) Transcript_24589:1815-2594(-)
MGCGASNNSNVANTGGNNTAGAPRRVTNNATTVSVSSRPNNVIPAASPLVRCKNYRHGSSLSQRDLDRMRIEFWSTRTEGNRIMWQSIRSAAEALVSNDLPLATAILEASNIVTPSGTMELLYDERGQQYKVPIYCISNPIELVGENGFGGGDGVGEENGTVSNTATTAPKIDGQPIALRVRVNPGDVNMAVTVSTSDTIKDLKAAVVETNNQSTNSIPNLEESRQRIIFMGRELKDGQYIQDVKFDTQKVVQVFLRPI